MRVKDEDEAFEKVEELMKQVEELTTKVKMRVESLTTVMKTKLADERAAE